MARMGRPKVDKPKTKQINVRLDEETYNKVKEYCVANKTTPTELLYGFIQVILGNKKE